MKRFILCVIFFVAVCVSVLFFTENKNYEIPENNICRNYIEEKNCNEKNYEEDCSKPCIITKENKNTEALYELKEYDGNIAIFKSNEKTPYKITSISIKDLPEKDREILKEGIKVSSENELNILIEDYCS